MTTAEGDEICRMVLMLVEGIRDGHAAAAAPKPPRISPRPTAPRDHIGPWVASAACHGQTDLFFTDVGTGNGHDRARRTREDAARAICAGCPVRGDCLEHALATREPLGIWGGLDPEQRHRLDANRRRAANKTRTQRTP